MKDMKNTFFLLGGYDLEMLEIRDLLEKQKVTYFDNQLRWDNAFLNQYTDILPSYSKCKNTTIYGIELQEQGVTCIPENYIRIDHHNDYNSKPSSLQQVADILGVSLNRYQQLVAANDSGYIPAMQALGATPVEIMEIRRKDRAAQGVTEKDELLAEKAILEKSIKNNIIIIKAYSSRFSPICDRLYPYRQLLIYTDDELMYYGEGKKLLTKKFTEEIKDGKMFHGGSDNGYLGTVKGIFSKEEIIILKENIKSYLTLNS